MVDTVFVLSFLGFILVWSDMLNFQGGSKTWKTFATFGDVSGLGNMEKQHGT